MPPTNARTRDWRRTRGLIELSLPQEILALCIRFLVVYGETRSVTPQETRDVVACGAVSRHFRASAILAGLPVHIGGLRRAPIGLPRWTRVPEQYTSVSQIGCGDMLAAFAPWNVRRLVLSLATVSDVSAFGRCHTLNLHYLPNVQSVDGLGTCHTVTIVALPIERVDALATCCNVWLEFCGALVDVGALRACRKVTIVTCPSIKTTNDALARVPHLYVDDGGSLRDTGM